MAWYRLGTMQLPKPILIYYQLDQKEHISIKFCFKPGGSCNGLVQVRHHVVTRTNPDLLSIRPEGIYFREILLEIEKCPKCPEIAFQNVVSKMPTMTFIHQYIKVTKCTFTHNANCLQGRSLDHLHKSWVNKDGNIILLTRIALHAKLVLRHSGNDTL